MRDEDSSWMAEWERMTGRVSEMVSDLHGMNPVAEQGYRTIRSWIYDQRDDGLSRAEKELVMVVMNAARGQTDAAARHLKHGLKHGLTTTQVREVFSMLFLFLGVSWYLESGQALWKASQEGA